MAGLTQTLLRELFDYRDGVLYRKIKTAQRMKIGDRAGSINSRGYLLIGVQGKLYSAHRVIFLLHHGWLPGVIDHIDGDKLNNRIENLRAATASQNCQNARKRSDSTSGVKGVNWDKRRGKWQARCQLNGVVHHVGYFDDINDADAAARQVREQHHKEFARHV